MAVNNGYENRSVFVVVAVVFILLWMGMLVFGLLCQGFFWKPLRALLVSVGNTTSTITIDNQWPDLYEPSNVLMENSQ